MTYFVTGATGFIGRHLVERLLERDGDVYVLVRAGSVDALNARWGAEPRVKPVVGDLMLPLLGLGEREVEALREQQVDHFFHLAAIYDMTADEEANRVANVEGTRHAVELSNAIGAGTFHHVSSIAAAGSYKGLFREDMFDEGQKLDHPYHRTKFESERIARTQTSGPWRVYRPAIVVGHSQTGVMDKIDGPYYFFKAIQKLRSLLPQWFPLIGPELGYTNLVPVDYVAAAMDHIAHQPGLDGQAFHLADPRPQRSGEAMNEFARAAHAPQLALRIDRRLTAALPKGTLSMLMKLPAARGVRRSLLADYGIPDEIVDHIALAAQFDTRDTERALEGTGIEVPPLSSYATKLWDYWERNLDPDLFRDHSFEGAVNGKTAIITGASSGIGRAAALKIARAGGIPLLVARSADKLEETKREIEALGGTAYVYTADLSDTASIEQLTERIFADHPAVDILVNNAGRSIRRSIALSYDRFHDFERTIQLNYLGTIKLIIQLLPHMRERRSGHIVNVSSIGVQTNPPRFSAYVASKAALDAFTRVVGSETIGDNVSFTTIHMPLVRTAMIAPTRIYDSFPTISPDEAADLICEAIRSKPKQINTRLGTFGEVAYALAPKAVDQILHMAYKVFPDSAAAKGAVDPAEHASTEQVALAHLMKGVHW
ncbi:SDR family oxidoreductase [Conexibacter arvalis]|uniref:NAD(P)-dependent dehydrogenase (Short-subunit alcohol dehydrogenase family) n=1 Tax=Conexibacter arvalis TaxID=912552 RepID=A0A840IKN3_9ACTN|nr:SDR family oxidoreductase [Conexibacter arvalis]MBB4664480.1 NAD(P)-dependent dehydrogenase (short-subunit alcohol dehydrogenase family) [Conexibacter arvalis]